MYPNLNIFPECVWVCGCTNLSSVTDGNRIRNVFGLVIERSAGLELCLASPSPSPTKGAFWAGGQMEQRNRFRAMSRIF